MARFTACVIGRWNVRIYSRSLRIVRQHHDLVDALETRAGDTCAVAACAVGGDTTVAVLAIGVKGGIGAADLRKPSRHRGMTGNAIQRSRVGHVCRAGVNGRRAGHGNRRQ